MKRNSIMAFALIALGYASCNEKTKDAEEPIVVQEEEVTAMEEVSTFEIIPISHASTVLEWDNTIMYVDPVGGGEAYSSQDMPNVILITHTHGDHLDVETLNSLNTTNATFVVPQAVADKMPENLKTNLKVLENGASTVINEFTVTAIPMYNLREKDLDKHPKGVGNGYVIEKNEKRVYFSGDTEDIPEMRNLKNIDVAFICMNLPYTMTVENAASAVLDFAPKKVYPYHYRGKNRLSDVEKFREMVNEKNEVIEVVQLDWYPSRE